MKWILCVVENINRFCEYILFYEKKCLRGVLCKLVGFAKFFYIFVWPLKGPGVFSLCSSCVVLFSGLTSQWWSSFSPGAHHWSRVISFLGRQTSRYSPHATFPDTEGPMAHHFVSPIHTLHLPTFPNIVNVWHARSKACLIKWQSLFLDFVVIDETIHTGPAEKLCPRRISRSGTTNSRPVKTVCLLVLFSWSRENQCLPAGGNEKRRDGKLPCLFCWLRKAR